MLIARASGFAMFNADIPGNARSVVTFLFPAAREQRQVSACAAPSTRYVCCLAFISSLGLTSCERL
jgi:hypothetical protein